MIAFMAGMKTDMEGNFANINGKLNSTIKTVKDLEERVVATENKMRGMGDLVREIVKEHIVGDIAREELKVTAAAKPPPSTHMISADKENRYWLARRSLRIWPIRGACLHTSVGAFFLQKLGLDP